MKTYCGECEERIDRGDLRDNGCAHCVSSCDACGVEYNKRDLTDEGSRVVCPECRDYSLEETLLD